MLLRRITQHVKDQNWFAVGIDFAIVVIGVFIGIQVANWNGARQEANLKALIEERLIADFRIIDEELDAAVERMENQIIDLEIFRKALLRGTESPDEQEAILHALSRGMSYPRFVRRSVTYQELQDSGRLDLISDEDFRLVLSQFDQNQQLRSDNLKTIRDGMLRDGFRSGEYTTMADIKRDENGDFQIVELADFDFDAMLSDPDFILKVRSTIVGQTWIHSNVRWARRDADAVLTVIEELR